MITANNSSIRWTWECKAFIIKNSIKCLVCFCHLWCLVQKNIKIPL